MGAQGGITYQYYEGEPLWPFGWGLSYTKFALKWLSASHVGVSRGLLQMQLEASLMPEVTYNVSVENMGTVVSDVVVLAYITADSMRSSPVPFPRKELFAFCRMRSVQPARSQSCALQASASVIAHNSAIFTGTYTVSVELGDGTSIAGTLTVDDSAADVNV